MRDWDILVVWSVISNLSEIINRYWMLFESRRGYKQSREDENELWSPLFYRKYNT